MEAQQQRVATLDRERKRLVSELSVHQARAVWEATIPDASGVRRIQLAPSDGPVRECEPMVQALVAMGPCMVLAVSPSSGGVMLGASEGSNTDAGQTLRAALQASGGKGGGSPRLAQGSTPSMLQLEAVVRALGFS